MNYQDEGVILDFLEGNLTNKESSDFEKELSINKELKTKVEEFKDALLAVKIAGRKDLSNKISSITDNIKEENETNNRKTIKMKNENKNNKSLLWAVAAGFALLIVGYGVGNFLKGNATDNFDPKEVFSSNYNNTSDKTAGFLAAIAKENISTRGASPEDDEKKVMYKGEEITVAEFEAIEKLRRDTLLQGLKLFNSSKWRESKEILHQYTENYKEPVDDYGVALYHLAKTSLNQGLYEVASKNLDEFLTVPSEDKSLIRDAEWERALSYLMVNELKAKTHFETMAGDNSHTYQDEAKGILAYFD